MQLLDCRHAPSADDEQMLRYLHYHQIPYVVALTNCLLYTSRTPRPEAVTPACRAA